MTIQEFKTNSINSLKNVSPSPQLDVEVLLSYSLNYNRTALLLHYKDDIPEDKLSWLLDAIAKRQTGLPVAYITGKKEFFGYNFNVSSAVLIPKPDTEILVERAVELILEKMETCPDKILTICDMCTGSGCIGISVLRTLVDTYNIPYSKIPAFTLADISGPALEIARKNIVEIAGEYADRFHLVQTNLFEQFSLTGGWSFDLILTNPPYIPHSMVNELLQDGRNEPRLALDGDVTLTGDAAYNEEGNLADDGLEIIRNLIPQAKKHLSPYGIILMETGEYNAKAAASLGENHGFKTNIHTDLEGQLRVVEMY